MTVEAAVFTCSICGEPSRDICLYCTKDVCANHRCERCKRCSDCCECEVPLSAEEAHQVEETQARLEATPAAGEPSTAPAAFEAPAPAAEPAPPEPPLAELPAEPEAAQLDASQSSSLPEPTGQ
jgi:hypothetical protein